MNAARATALLLLLPATMSPSPLKSKTSPVVFTDVTTSAGISWKQVSGASVRHFLPETMGGGVGFLDFDHDGLLDIFLVTGGETGNRPTDRPAAMHFIATWGTASLRRWRKKPGLLKTHFMVWA